MATPESEVGDRQSDFNPATGTFLIAGQNAGPSAGIQMDWTALEPRLGAAWKPFGRSNTVVRGGYAIFHDSSWNMGAQGLWQNPPYYAESFEAGANMSAEFVTFDAPPNPADFEGPSCRKIRISSKAEFSSSISTSNRSCPAKLC